MLKALSFQKAKRRFFEKVNKLFGVDARSLVLFRIGLGLLTLADLIIKGKDLVAFYTDYGVLPRLALLQNSSIDRMSIFFISGNKFTICLLFLLAGFSALALTLGWRTRLATFLSWFCAMSLQVRNPVILSGSDEVLRLLLFWSIFLPLGISFSVDSKLNNSPGRNKPGLIISMATAALLMQVLVIYLFAFVFKTKTPAWNDGTATYYALSSGYGTTWFGLFLLNFPGVLNILTHLVFWFELLGPLFLLSPILTGPIRSITIFAFIILQIGFGLCLTIQLFPWAMTVAMLPFVPSWFWDKIFKSSIPVSDGNNKTFIPVNILATLCLVYILWVNLLAIGFKVPIPQWFQRIGSILYLDQLWAMYAPMDNKALWFVIPGKLQNGTEIDLLTRDRLGWDKPALISTIFENPNWQKYIIRIAVLPYFKAYLPYYGSWLCHNWNDHHSAKKRLVHFELFGFSHQIAAPESHLSYSPHKWSILKYQCPAEDGHQR